MFISGRDGLDSTSRKNILHCTSTNRTSSAIQVPCAGEIITYTPPQRRHR